VSRSQDLSLQGIIGNCNTASAPGTLWLPRNGDTPSRLLVTPVPHSKSPRAVHAMSCSAGAPHAGTSSRTAVIAGQGRSLDPPSPCPHGDHAPSDPSAAATPVALDMSALQAAAGAVNTFIQTYQDLLARYQQAVRDLVAARRHNEELDARGRPDWDTVRGFVDFVQNRYDVSQGRFCQAI
jgi:hypothetical protein